MLTAAVVVTVFPLHTYFAVNVIVPAVVTFDAVGSSGYKESSKRYVNLGSANESFNFSMEIKPDDFYKKDGELITAVCVTIDPTVIIVPNIVAERTW